MRGASKPRLRSHEGAACKGETMFKADFTHFLVAFFLLALLLGQGGFACCWGCCCWLWQWLISGAA